MDWNKQGKQNAEYEIRKFWSVRLLYLHGIWKQQKYTEQKDTGWGVFSRNHLTGLEPGVNSFDTAIGYQSGISEQYVDRALCDFARRKDVVAVTKFLSRT